MGYALRDDGIREGCGILALCGAGERRLVYRSVCLSVMRSALEGDGIRALCGDDTRGGMMGYARYAVMIRVEG
eukprot:770738-Rhodomonas_salina.1